MKLFAFWRYDQFPYVIGDTFDPETLSDDGTIKPDHYGGSTFKPFKIVTVKAGKELYDKLKALKKSHEKALMEVDKDFEKRLNKIMPEANNLWRK